MKRTWNDRFVRFWPLTHIVCCAANVAFDPRRTFLPVPPQSSNRQVFRPSCNKLKEGSNLEGDKREIEFVFAD